MGEVLVVVREAGVDREVIVVQSPDGADTPDTPTGVLPAELPRLSVRPPAVQRGGGGGEGDRPVRLSNFGSDNKSSHQSLTD